MNIVVKVCSQQAASVNRVSFIKAGGALKVDSTKYQVQVTLFQEDFEATICLWPTNAPLWTYHNAKEPNQVTAWAVKPVIW